MYNFFHFRPLPAQLLCAQNVNFPFKSSSGEVIIGLNKWNFFKTCVPYGVNSDFPEMSRQLISLSMCFLTHFSSKTFDSIYWQYAKVIASHKQEEFFICNYWRIFPLLDFQSCSRDFELVRFFFQFGFFFFVRRLLM